MSNLFQTTNRNETIGINFPDLRLPQTGNKQEWIETINVRQLLDLYNAKCFDNNIEFKQIHALYFLQKMKKQSLYRKFRLDRAGLGIQASKVLLNIFSSNDHFVNVNFSQNNLLNEGVLVFAQSLKVNTSIIHLDISSNGIGSSGFKSLFLALACNTWLVSLDISSKDGWNRNRLGGEGAEELSAFLRRNKILQFLNIAGLAISTDQLEPIMKGVRESQRLEVLNLANNKIDSSGCVHIT